MSNTRIKSYMDCMNEISHDRLYEGLLAYGLFSEKLPPIFSSQSFYTYCQNKSITFSAVEHDYIVFESIRNTNTIREIGIPTPMAYQRLCAMIRDNWDTIRTHFKLQTEKQNYKISRIHIRIDAHTRKIFNTDYNNTLTSSQQDKKELFSMSSENWRVDGTPQVDLRIGSRYRVKADISTCFPSIYTHAIPWAVIGKAQAKQQRRGGWYNDLDHTCRNIKNGETHGLLIGPHSSNLISEIILTVIDKQLYDQNFRFMRYVDDYTCYVDSIAQAQNFIQKLSRFLRQFGLTLNNKKTAIEELPLADEEDWVSQLNSLNIETYKGITTYKDALRYLDLAINLFYSNNKNCAIFNYALKVLSGKNLSTNAEIYTVKTVLHLALKYTYLVPHLQNYIFKIYSTTTKQQIKNFSDRLFYDSLYSGNHEPLCYAIYFALIYKFQLKEFEGEKITRNKNFKQILNSENCISKLMLYFYCKKYHTHSSIEKHIKDHAKSLYQNDMDKNWLFIYEVLSSGQLKDEWKSLKKENISFLHPDFIREIS